MEHAYVTTLYGDNDYYYGVLVLGYTLKQTGTQYPLICLVTQDVPKWKLSNLQIFYEIIEIDYLNPHNSWFRDYRKSRFQGVFTKLEVLKLCTGKHKYNKIMMLDSDMLVLKSLDYLFNLDAPAALTGKLKEKLNTGDQIPAGNGINAGIMILKPDLQEYYEIVKELNRKCPHKGYQNPEQEYLSDHWSGKWRHISQIYNFQYFKYHKYIKGRERVSMEAIYNIHYSWIVKPWHLYLTRKKWALKQLTRSNVHGNYKKYFELWYDSYKKLSDKLGKDLKLESEIMCDSVQKVGRELINSSIVIPSEKNSGQLANLSSLPKKKPILYEYSFSELLRM